MTSARSPWRGWTALIGGIAYCGSRALRAHNDRDIRTYRTRSGKPALAFNADAIEQELIAKLENLEFPPHVKIKVREILLEQTSDAERARADAAGRKARAALLDLERKSALGDIDEATYRTLKDEFHEQIDAAERILREPDQIERTMAALTNLGSVVKNAPQNSRWQAMHSLFEQVEVTMEGKVGKMVPRNWAKGGFALLKAAWKRRFVTSDDPYGTRTRV
jgi:hypothetical protein